MLKRGKTANRTRSWNAKNSLFGPLFPSIKNEPNRSGRFFFLFFLYFFFRQTHKFSPSVFLPPLLWQDGGGGEERFNFRSFFFRGRPPRSQILFANISPEKSNGLSYAEKCPLTMTAVATTKENILCGGN